MRSPKCSASEIHDLNKSLLALRSLIILSDYPFWLAQTHYKWILMIIRRKASGDLPVVAHRWAPISRHILTCFACNNLSDQQLFSLTSRYRSAGTGVWAEGEEETEERKINKKHRDKADLKKVINFRAINKRLLSTGSSKSAQVNIFEAFQFCGSSEEILCWRFSVYFHIANHE